MFRKNKTDKTPQGGFITLIVMMLLILAVVLFLAYARVKSSGN